METLRLKLNVKIWGMKIANSTITPCLTNQTSHSPSPFSAHAHTHPCTHIGRSSIFVQAGLVFARRKHVCEISGGTGHHVMSNSKQSPPHKYLLGRPCHQPPFFCFTERPTTEAHIQLFPTPIFFFFPVI